MKTILFLLVLNSNGTQLEFPLAEFFFGSEACELAAPAIRDAVKESYYGSYLLTFVYDLDVECREVDDDGT